MVAPIVFFVHLRRPIRANPNEQRDDPFYEFGSFGCTGCHFRNLLHPNNAKKLEGARLAFVQGGELGSRLVFLTPPITTVTVGKERCEAKWKPADMPFKYAEAPILVCNDGNSDFALIEQFANEKNGRTVEGRLSSRLRSRTLALSPKLANHVVTVYEQKRDQAPRSAFAKTYVDALPYPPRKIDDKRKETYDRLVAKLNRGKQSRCARSRRRKAVGHLRSCD